MLYYLNRGFIIEQALADLIQRYFHRLRLDKVYDNFHLSVTNDHPFAHLLIDSDSTTAADTFPSIVITTQTDSKINEFQNLPEQYMKVQLTADDLDQICYHKRTRTYINEDGEEVVYKKRDGSTVEENVPGYCIVTDEETINKLKEYATENEYVPGISYSTRKRDKISIEIWAENNQLKNELYEQLRLYISTTLNNDLDKVYPIFDSAIFGHSINGERSNNYNFDFDTVLYGSHITFDVDYNIGQIIIDTESKDFNSLEWEVINHVKENKCIG